MKDRLFVELRPVRTRQRLQAATAAGSWGLLAGAGAMIAMGMARICGLDVPLPMAAAAAGGGLILGSLLGLMRTRSWKSAAAAVDSHFQLKDRAATAVEFAGQPETTVLEGLEIADAVEHLCRVDGREATPWTVPPAFPYAVFASILAVVLLAVPLGTDRVEAAPAAPLPHVLAAANSLEETMIPELEEWIEKEPEPQLETLVEELKQLVDAMQEPAVDQREALAKLSEMQAAIAEALAEYNLEAVDASLQQLGDAVSSIESMKAASGALKEGRYKNAADELENLDARKITKKEAKTAASKLQQLAAQMEDEGLGQLSEAATELAEGLESGDSAKCKSGACRLAKLVRQQELRKGIGMCLGCQLARLAECKGACCGKNGGTSVAKSDRPTNNWGTGASNKPFGDPTSPVGNRDRQDITGTPGEGPSEKEIAHAPEGRQLASRSYREMYQEYRKMSEAVLANEPLPLGHRQTIRRYFELIRPQNDDVDDLQPPADSRPAP